MDPRPSDGDHGEGQIQWVDNRRFMGTSSSSVSTRIMVAAIIVLFVVVLFIIFLHIYARCFWSAARLRARSRNWSRRFRRRASRLRYFAETPPQQAGQQQQQHLVDRGLDKSVLEALPVFVYTKTFRDGKQGDGEQQKLFDCAVCLSEFEEKEACRRLPACNHVFHTDCIDMWFTSHSTCPLCRCSVGLDDKTTTTTEVPAFEGSSLQPASNAVAIQILQDEGSVLLNPQQQQQVDTVAATTSSNQVNDGSTDLEARSSHWKQEQLVIVVPPRPRMSSSQLPSPSPSEGQRSPLSAHLRSIRRLLSRDYNRATTEDACCEQSSPAALRLGMAE